MTVTDDAFLGGDLKILQPRQGYRAGLDAVMLAAAVADRSGAPFRVLDAGAGVGTAGLAVARRCPSAEVVLIEREPELVMLAAENIARNGLQSRVSVVQADIAALTRDQLAAHELEEAAFDQVIANPPYFTQGAGTAAPNALKAAAHVLAEDGLEPWCRFLARMAKPGGEALIVQRAAALPDLLEKLSGRFGGLSVLPIHSHAGEAAHRILVRGCKGSRAPFCIEGGIVLHEADERFTAGAERVLRLGQALHVAYGLDQSADAAGAAHETKK